MVHCIDNILFGNGLFRHFVEESKGKDTRDGKTWKKSEHLLDERRERRRYWKLKEEVLDRTAWKTRYEKTMDFTQSRITTGIALFYSFTYF
jgi:hypothetical protein